MGRKENKEPEDHYEPLYLLQRSLGRLLPWSFGCTDKQGYCCLLTCILYVTCVFSSVQLLSHVRLFATPESQHARPPCPSPTPGVHSDSRPSSQWWHPVISSSVVPFFSCPQSLPASESFPMSQLFAWGGQSIRYNLYHSCHMCGSDHLQSFYYGIEVFFFKVLM